ncbi:MULTISPECIES: YnfA family protein [Acetobacter]|uniref:YnfA family protein n=1 Tax=Acetobacter thailandicus TaxID=1502842 RepID=A0ABT3QGM3_9PROT|nr:MULTISPECIES: YnfA family protein [Acetobacter]MCX2564437.1 YnfA family protein [Acetobacter thailandicus]NHN95417.1 YnfA family protein [Acetobacter thailandicus]OUJ09136.1 hypothetical protein HK25_12315 [Acetobacter sp. DsW_059]
MLFFIKPVLIYILAGFAEIAGCYMAWLWLREGRSAWLLLPGAFSLAVFALLLTRIETDSAGRAYAAYGGIYIMTSLLWMRCVEGRMPDKWEIAGAAVCLFGAGLILLAPRGG